MDTILGYPDISPGHLPRTFTPTPMNRPMEAELIVIRPTSIYGLNYFHRSSFHLNNEYVSSNVRVA